MIKFDLLYRAVIDWDASCDTSYEVDLLKNTDFFTFWLESLRMTIPLLFPSLRNYRLYYYDNHQITEFYNENAGKLFDMFQNNKSKIVNIVIVQEIGTLNILAILYKSDDIESYRAIIQELIDSEKIYDLLFKKMQFEIKVLPTNLGECGCEKCECQQPADSDNLYYY